MASDPFERVSRFLHLHSKSAPAGDTLNPAITLASVYAMADDGEATHQYGRWSNPTWSAVEEALGVLEAATAVAFPSGMAAAAAVLYALLRPGDRVLIPADSYYGLRSFVERYLAPMGIEVDAGPSSQMESADLRGCRLVWVETPTNPLLDLVDISVMAERAHAAGATLAVDNTTMTPIGQSPLELGADLVVSSDTKATNGHSDVMAGHVATRDEILAEQVREWRRATGAIPGPFEAWLLHRGLETLEVRFTRMCANANEVAVLLSSRPDVASVTYPGLPSHPRHELATRQMRMSGCVVVAHFSDASRAQRFIDRASQVRPTTSFGGVHTSAERRARWEPVDPGLVRISVGTEPTEGLLADLEKALG
ncbi:MAG TPA: cystathionine gamma-lyase [Acidimicrobiia bacterium]|jgi:cystathionine gamma-lyase